MKIKGSATIQKYLFRPVWPLLQVGGLVAMDLIWQERNRKVRQQQTVKTPHGFIVHQTESALLSAIRFNYVSTSLRSQYIRIKS